jgi:hydrogenase-4 component B
MISPGDFFILFLILCSLGVVLSVFLPERRNPLLLAWISSIAAISVLWSSGIVLLYGLPFRIELWTLPFLGTLFLQMDRLSALFVFITGLVFLPVSIFSAGYMKKYLGRYNLKTFSVFYHLLFASIVLLLIANDIFSFLLTWEIMSILSYLLVNYEHEKDENTSSGYLMLAMSEAGTILVAIAFLLLVSVAGSLDFASLKSASAGLGDSSRWAIFLLSFFGFSVKAGLVPVNSWLPRAHPAAPGNVSAVLSGVIVNLGIYGIIRVNVHLLAMTSAGPGLIVLLVGAISALVGVLYANIEHNLKTMLAHHTVEQMGIVTIGLGAGLVFAATDHPVIATIAFLTALYHMTNHSIYKALLFMSAAWVDTTVGVRDMDRLGGLIKRMPWTALFFLIGAISLVALPPFNGFVSEWLTLQVLLRSAELSSTGTKIAFALCGASLALTTALAVTCFVKAFAMSFLGVGRSNEVAHAREAPRSMVASMAVLAALCLLLGVLPTYVIPVLDEVVTPLTGTKAVDALVPPFFTVAKGDPEFSDAFVSEFHDIGAQTGRNIIPGRGLVVLHRGTERNPVVFAMSTSYTLVILTLLLGGTFILIRILTKSRTVTRKPVWDGGVRRLMPEMTYTATGFSNPVRVIFEAIFRPSTLDERKETIAEHFRTAINNERKEVHIVDRSVFQPIVKWIQSMATLLGRMHTGSVNIYATYVVISLVIVLIIQALLKAG